MVVSPLRQKARQFCETACKTKNCELLLVVGRLGTDLASMSRSRMPMEARMVMSLARVGRLYSGGFPLVSVLLLLFCSSWSHHSRFFEGGIRVIFMKIDGMEKALIRCLSCNLDRHGHEVAILGRWNLLPSPISGVYL